MPMPLRPTFCLLLSSWIWASVPALAQDNRLVVANLILPDTVWPTRRDDILQVLQLARPDVLAIQDVQTRGKTPPAVCSLALPLAMHCDFVSTDPPSAALRRGMALLSARPIVEDGASLLHGKDGSLPVAAGYWRLALGPVPVGLYSASLSPGPALAGRRLQQAGDLRDWMASHAPAQVSIVVARFGSQHHELQQLMPGLRTARKGIAGSRAHGLDVLYPANQAKLKATTLLELEAAPADAVAASASASAAQSHIPVTEVLPPRLLGIVVELELDSAAAAADTLSAE